MIIDKSGCIYIKIESGSIKGFVLVYDKNYAHCDALYASTIFETLVVTLNVAVGGSKLVSLGLFCGILLISNSIE
jgi:hypothetical protein